MAGGRILGPSFPSFRQLAAPWAKSYDGRRGPMAADCASRLKSRMFLGASSPRCFVVEAARTRNPNTMVLDTFSHPYHSCCLVYAPVTFISFAIAERFLVNRTPVFPVPSSSFARLRPPIHHSSFIIPCAGVGSPIVAHRQAQFQEKFLGHAARIFFCRTGLA